MTKTMKLFLAIVSLHWVEHIVQAYQVYFLHIHRACALGLVGMKYPWLVRTEIMHFMFAVLTLVGFFVAGWKYFVNSRAVKLWTVGAMWASWHVIEHTLLLFQATTHHYIFGRHEPTSILQLFAPRMEIHLFYNSIITLFLVLGLWFEHRDRDRDIYEIIENEKCGDHYECSN